VSQKEKGKIHMSNLMQNVLAVVLIVGMLLLAGIIYIPSYLEARSRAKTALVRNRMREYAVWRDQNPDSHDSYPPENLVDPFTKKPLLLIDGEKRAEQTSTTWFLISTGPDKRYDCGTDGKSFSLDHFIPYDLTNGTASSGDILIGSDISSEFSGIGFTRSGDWVPSYYMGTREKKGIDRR
jgi:hypothetical protein